MTNRRFFLALLLVALGFWTGYTVACYRTAHEHLPVAARFSSLGLASFMLRSAERIDSGEIDLLRRKLLAVARSQIQPLDYAPPGMWSIASSPYFLERQSENLRSLNEGETAELLRKLEQLESNVQTTN